MIEFRRKQIVLLVLAGVIGCRAMNSGHRPPSKSLSTSLELNQGYSLLHKLLADESQVGGIFILKHADPAIKVLVTQIGQACKTDEKRLEKFAGEDSSLSFDVPDLPYIEQRSRDLQASDDKKALLLSSGEKFQRRLIFTQAEAMNYAAQLSRALLEKEANATRKSFLQVVQKQSARFHDQLMDHLKVEP